MSGVNIMQSTTFLSTPHPKKKTKKQKRILEGNVL